MAKTKVEGESNLILNRDVLIDNDLCLSEAKNSLVLFRNQYISVNKVMKYKQSDLPAKSEIFSYWHDKFHEINLFIDWGEPSCWACGFHYNAKYDINNVDAAWENILKLWDKIPLQRCHIVPRSLGGTNNPNNLFLMCKECHDLAPNTNIPDIFYEWISTQNHLKREMKKIQESLESFNLSLNNMIEIEQVIKSEDFNTWVKEGRIGLHFPQNRYASRSWRLTTSTYVGLAVYYMRNIKQ